MHSPSNENDGRCLLVLVGTQRKHAEEVGRALMRRDHAVALSDSDDDIALFIDVVDAVIDLRDLGSGEGAAVLCRIKNRADPSREGLRDAAVLELPATSRSMTAFERTIQEL